MFRLGERCPSPSLYVRKRRLPWPMGVTPPSSRIREARPYGEFECREAVDRRVSATPEEVQLGLRLRGESHVGGRAYGGTLPGASWCAQ